MSSSESTRWTLVRRAAEGEPAAREAFAVAYEDAVRAYLRARWRGTNYASRVDDAVQDVFLDCFRDAGALARAEPGRAGGFRAFLYGLVRIVALRHERAVGRNRGVPVAGHARPLEDLPDDEPGYSTAFERAWALGRVQDASSRLRARAAAAGPAAVRRVELLRLRFEENRPIREIARLLDEAPAHLHHGYARAREEFHRALLDVVAEDHPGTPEEVEEEARRLLRSLA